MSSSPQPRTPETPPPQKKPPDPFNRSNPANQWRYAFEHYITHPEDHPREVVYYNENWVLIRDAYPKASVHLLLLTRNPDFWFIHPLTALQDASFAASTRTQVTKGRRIAGSELRRLYGHESALENAKANLLSQGVDLAAEADASGGEDEAAEATMAMLGRDWDAEVVVGVHAQPSMAHFHVHFISRDLHSPALKNKKHYNSFQAPFFVGLERFWNRTEAGRNGQTEFEEHDMEPAERQRREQERREELRESVETRMREAPEYLKRDLVCWKCGEGFGNRFAALKEHLEGEFERWKRI